MKPQALIIFCVGILTGSGFVSTLAFQDRHDPILDAQDKKYIPPDDFNQKSLKDLIELRDFYAKELEMLSKTVEEKADKKKLLSALVQYDEARISIIDVIPDLIKEYKIEGELRTSLETYRQTFQSIHNEFAPGENSLSGYKRYGFRIVAAYASMLLLIRTTDAALHERLLADLHNPKTAIGKYIAAVDSARANVEAVNAEVKEYHLVRQLRGNIDRINSAIAAHGDWP